MSKYVMGLDLSLTSTGVAVVDWEDAMTMAWTLPLDRKVKGDYRLVHLSKDLEGLLRQWEPALVVLEDLPTHAKSAGLTGRAQGVAREVLRRLDVPYMSTSPATLKKSATGSGRADKQGMREAAEMQSARARSILSNSDEVDAYWLAQMGLEYIGLENSLIYPEVVKLKEEK
ncbi:crossover junction endodeoxyribonuclease RuvC [Nesterenkonia sp. CL21]|uniref:crossover junction endodeoxyribonuclease RuvC n=1 Tax=Nesterenkonia sp. CL21 TaxID=3064894 RepID=UPI0028791817|nr:crossover junction endodeoxyribonuclease RuvC [Nesterenkonia sp. CL21]MDS2171588.1 crossover junction endodeoxyribonuclease RuvC [Nesterenkonia sp. CL21]